MWQLTRIPYIDPAVDILKSWWAWLRCHPGLTITGGIGLVVSILTAIGFIFNIPLAYRKLKQSKREEAIETTVRKIEAMEAETKRTKGFSVSRTSITPEPGEDPEIVAEAWRRFQQAKRNMPRNLDSAASGRHLFSSWLRRLA